jgi:hypothetical protein
MGTDSYESHIDESVAGATQQESSDDASDATRLPTLDWAHLRDARLPRGPQSSWGSLVQRDVPNRLKSPDVIGPFTII